MQERGKKVKTDRQMEPFYPNFILVQGTCLKDKLGNAYCQCVGSFTGDDCETKSEFAYIAGGETIRNKNVYNYQLFS